MTMSFILVNGRAPRPRSACAWCRDPLTAGYVRDVASGLFYCCHPCYVDHRDEQPARETGRRAS